MKSLLAAAALALMATAAHAAPLAPTELYKGPYWTVAYSSAANSCVLSTGMSTPAGDQGMVTVKYFAEHQNLALQIFKSSWRFPPQGVSIPMAIWFDGKPTPFGGSGTGYPSQTSWPMVEINVKPDDSKAFMDWFAAANTMAVQFTQGTEAPWKTSLIGSREATAVFAKCIVSVSGAGATTQPYGNGNSGTTQPYSTTPQPSQPYATTPKKPKTDDGAI